MTETFPIPLGRYLLVERLAVGGMAELFRARAADGQPDVRFESAATDELAGDEPTDEPTIDELVGDEDAPASAGTAEHLAIKRLLPHLTIDPYFRGMFLDEAKLTARLSHPNIIRTYDYGDHDGHLYMVMELVDGLDGLSILRECAHRQVRMPVELAVYATHEVLSALDFAHAQVDEHGKPLGVVHRDISPANVLFGKDGAVKLADFGIAHANQHEQRTKDGTLKGKYGYMSPEQVSGTIIDSRSDVFSAGVLLAEMMMGRRLFAGPSELDVLLMVRDVRLDRLEKYGDHIGVDLDRILRKALRHDPAERFATAASFREALAEWMYMHQHDVSSVDIQELIGMLYDDAWARKRERTARLAEDLARMKAAAGAVVSPWSGTPSGPLPTAPAPVEPDVGTDADVSVESDADSDAETNAWFAARPANVSASDGVPTPVGRTASGSSIGRIPLSSKIIRNSSQSPIIERDSTNRYRRPTTESPIEDLAHLHGSHQDPVSGPASNPLDEPTMEFNPSVRTDSRTTHDPILSPLLDFDDDIISEVRDLRTTGVVAPTVPDVEAVSDSRPVNVGDVQGIPDESGDFASVSAIELFYRLATEQSTGLLVARVGEVCKEIYLRRGVPEYVASNLDSDLFGEYLIRNQAISPGELSSALAMQPHYGGKIGETLVGLGLLQPLDVFRYLSQQLREKVIDVCTWNQGSYQLYLGRENLQPKFPLALNAFEILGASVRLLDTGTLFAWADSLDDCRPVASGESPVSPEMFGLGRSVRRVLSALDGSQTVAELRSMHALSRKREEAWVRIFYLLVYTHMASL